MSTHVDSFVASGTSPTEAIFHPASSVSEVNPPAHRFVLNVFLADLCAKAGVKLVGVQQKLVDHVDELLLFDLPTGTTLAVSFVGASVDTIRDRVEKHEAETRTEEERLRTRDTLSLSSNPSHGQHTLEAGPKARPQ